MKELTSLSKWELFTLMGSKEPYVLNKGQIYIIQSIEREDGSGNCFNVEIQTTDRKYLNVFVRCE